MSERRGLCWTTLRLRRSVAFGALSGTTLPLGRSVKERCLWRAQWDDVGFEVLRWTSPLGRSGGQRGAQWDNVAFEALSGTTLPLGTQLESVAFGALR